MSRGKQTRMWPTAYHEAGHALAALREGREVTEVRLYPDCPDSGLTTWSGSSDHRLFRSSEPDGDLIPEWHELLQERLGDIRISLAGPLAEAKLMNKPLRALGAESDLVMCQTITHSMRVRYRHLKELVAIVAPDNSGIPETNMLELVEEQRRKVRRWVARPVVWTALGDIAGQLIKQSNLGCEDLLRLTTVGGTKDAGQMALPL